MIIRQSTARTILVGPVLDSAGAAKTDEVVGSIRITKNGTVGSANVSATLTHDHAGKYRLALTATDTDTVGVLEVSLNSGTNDMPIARLCVVEETVYDALFAAAAAGYQVPIWSSAGATVNLSGTTVKTLTDAVALPTSASINITGNITGNVSGSVGSVTAGVTVSTLPTMPTDWITAAGLSAGAVAEIQSGLSTYAGGDTSGTTTLLARLTATRAGYLDNLSGGAVMLASSYSAPPSASTIASQVDTTLSASHGSGSWATATGFSTLDAAGVRSAVGLASANLDTQLADLPTNSELASALGSADDATLAAIAGLSIPSAAANASAVRSELTTELGRIDAAVSTRLAAADYTAPANSDIAAIKAKTDNLPAEPAAVGDIPTAATIADAVWDETQSGHTTAGTFGKYLDAAVSSVSGGGGLTAADVWGYATRELTALPTIPANWLTAAGIAADAISEIQSGLSTLNAAGVRSAIGLATANLDTQLADLPTNSELTAALGSADDATLAAIAALTIPTAGQNATAVRSELATELGRIDVAIGTRLAAAGYTAPANADITAIKAKTDNLPVSPAAVGSPMTLADDAITAAKIAANALAAAKFAADACEKIADILLRRTMANVEASSHGDALSIGSMYGAIQQAQESSISGATQTVRKTDGTTTLGTKTISKTAGDDPIRGIS